MNKNKDPNPKRRLAIKGLDKIFGEEITELINEMETSPTSREKSINIPIAEIRTNPYQPRIIFNDAEIMQLAQSIVKHGVIQPILVKKAINGYEVIVGERRLRASKKAGLNEIPAIVVDFSDRQMMEVALIENIQRVDLNTIEEAQAYRDLMNNLNLTQGEVAIQVGKSRSHVANIMRILNLPQKVQDYVLSGKLTMGQVKPLLTLQSDHALISRLSDRIFEESLTARKVEDIVRGYQLQIGKKEQPLKQPQVNKYQEVTEKMIRKLGTKVIFDEKKFTIKFSNDKDLNRILEILQII